jgi:hypothetical protein
MTLLPRAWLGANWAPGRLAELDGLRQLLTYGFFAGWFHGVHAPRRFAYLLGGSATGSGSGGLGAPLLARGGAAPRRCCRLGRRLPWFPLVFLLAIPAFDAITGMNTRVAIMLHFSLSESLLLSVPHV